MHPWSTGHVATHKRTHRWTTRIALATIGALVATSVAFAPPAAADASTGWPRDPDNLLLQDCAAPGSDEFDADALTEAWTRVVRENGDRHSLSDGALHLPTYSGGFATARLIQQPLPSGPWQLTSELHFEPAANFQQAGLMLYESDSDVGKLSVGWTSSGKAVEIQQVDGGVSRKDTLAPNDPTATTVWLRLTSDGSTIQSSVSYDGTTFVDHGRPLDSAVNSYTHVGPFAYRGDTTAPEITADFAWFRWSPTRESYEADCTAHAGHPDLGSPGNPGPEPGEGDPLELPQALPLFEYTETVVDPSTQVYNPTDEFIFPSVFHAGQYLDDPLGEWYLYYAPHDTPGGILLMHADSLEGPWTQHPGNPLISRTWPGAYSVQHVSSPDAYWKADEGKMYLYYHGDNQVTRYATSEDGIHFEYGGVAVTAQNAGPTVSDVSYARVFDHPDPTSAYPYVMLYGEHHDDINSRRIRIAFSRDARTWELRDEPLIMPGPADGRNIAAANLWEWNGRFYVVYHNSNGTIIAREVNRQLTIVGAPQLLYVPSEGAPDNRRAASPEMVTADGVTSLFYEAGDRSVHSWVINRAELVPGLLRELPGDPWQDCSAPGSDTFDGNGLDSSIWTASRGLPAPGVSMHDGALHIETGPTGVAGAPLALQPAPDGEWEVTTALRLRAIENFQQGGLILHRDDSNYARVSLGYGRNGLTLGFTVRTNGTERTEFGTDVISAPRARGESVWLRLASSDGTLEAAYSVDGRTFTELGRPATVNTASATIGLFAIRGATTADPADAAFDWFQFTPGSADLVRCATDDEVAPPGVGVLSSTSGWAYGLDDGNYEVRMNLWWDTNASRFRLFENDELIATIRLDPSTPEAQTAVVPITGRVDGRYEYRGELINSQGVTATKPVTVEVTDAEPGVPVLSHDDRDRDGTFTLSADLWWGTNATSWRALEDGVEIASGDLTEATPRAQHVDIPIGWLPPDEYTFVIEFTNHAGTTTSEPLTITVR